jgi:L-threonylcarbamoyladenylate synthase
VAIVSGNDAAAVAQAAERLAAGGLVAFPTETVYGLGARVDDDAAVARVFAAKGRPADHPLIVHVADRTGALHFAPAPGDQALRLMGAFWPGPLTVIVPRHPSRAAAAAGGQSSIGLRMPAHPVALALLRAAAGLGVPGVAAPSANRFGRVSPTRAVHVAQEFGPDLLVLDGGDCEVGIESAIVDCTRAAPALLRPGQLGRARIEQVLGEPLAARDAASPRASGTLESHYAPRARVVLLASDELRRRVAAPPGGGSASGPMDGRTDGAIGVYSRLLPAVGWWHHPMPVDAGAAAHELFAVLHMFDARGAGAIWVEAPPPDPAWDGVRDRLQRAAAS